MIDLEDTGYRRDCNNEECEWSFCENKCCRMCNDRDICPYVCSDMDDDYACWY